MLWRFNSELQLDRSAKKDRKKEKCETLLGGSGCGTYFPHSLNFKTRSYAYNVLKKKKKPCILCRCRSFNSSLCRLSPFQLSFVAVSWPCHLSASVFCACAFFTYHRLRWIKLTKLFLISKISFQINVLFFSCSLQEWGPRNDDVVLAFQQLAQKFGEKFKKEFGKEI